MNLGEWVLSLGYQVHCFYPWVSLANLCSRSFCLSLNLYCSRGLYQTTNPKLLNTIFQRPISRVRTYYPTKEGTLLAPLTLVFVCYSGLDQHQHSSALLDKDVSGLPQPFRGKSKWWVWSWSPPQNAPNTMSLCSCLSTHTDYKWEQNTA